MLNLKMALAQDVAEGIRAAQAAGTLPAVKEELVVPVRRTDTPEHGQYASPVALSLARNMKKEPAEIVAAIVEHMPKKEYIGAVQELNGFLNVRLNPGWMMARLDDVITEELCDTTAGQGQSVNLEFLSANPTGPLTLANARAAFYADTLARVLACAGWSVIREYYVNDAGEQVRRLGESVVRRILQSQGETVDFPPDLYQGEYVKEIAAQLAEEWRENEGKEFTKEDLVGKEVVARVSERAVALMLVGIRTVCAEVLKIDFDVWTSEKKLRESGAVEKTLEMLRARKVTYKKEGAEFLKTSAYGDSEDRVIVKRDGEFSYFLPDVAYHQNKFAREYHTLFTFLGADHQGHVPRLYAALKALGYDTERLKIVVAQLFRLVSGGEVVKISKRAGTLLTPQDLIEAVGYDAARFGLISHGLNTAIDFDLDLAREQSERNPVYYIQYAYVRLQAILRKAKEEGVISEVGEMFDLSSHPPLTHTLELELLAHLYRFPEMITDISNTYAVHDLAYYARDLAGAVHAFYKHVPVLASDKSVLFGRLQLVLATRTVLGKVFDLLGVSRLEVM